MANPSGPQLFTALMFLGVVFSAGMIQVGVDLSDHGRPQALDIFTREPNASNLRAYEEQLEETSWVVRKLRPWMQYAQFKLLKDAGDKALAGRDGWYFYKPGVQYLTSRSQVSAATVSTDPLPAIREFRDQLARRGIRLLVMPAPNKESVYPEMLSRRAQSLNSALCARTRDLLARLRAEKIDVIDLFALYGHHKKNTDSAAAPLYLAQDSHWSPAGVDLAAQAVAACLLERDWVRRGETAYAAKPLPVNRVGDVLRMLQVPQIERAVIPETIHCAQVIRPDTREKYQDDANAQVLVLGDSFLRIFERDEPGSAGFVAHLAKALNQPVASMVSDGGASTLVRQQLHRRPGLLRNKKVVIWEFVERDIRFGAEGWQMVPLPREL